jgi:mannose-6-phosphate isomerase
MTSAPLRLSPERAWRTYLGGSLLDSFHGKQSGGDGHFPEEWIMSVVTARNAGREDIVEGLSRLADNPETTLKQLVDADPAAMLGAEHARKFGATPGVLVKLIDSSERLTIQTHPDKAHARSLFRSDYGKTECWHILGGRAMDNAAPCVYLGFKEGVTRERWKNLFDKQDIPGMLDAMHCFDVEAGETILIEGGVPHAIGAGCFLAEIQEPTDFTIRIERVTPSGFPVADMMCHQGLGFERMFECFTYEGISREEARNRWFVQATLISGSAEKGENSVWSLIAHDRCPCFRLDKITVAPRSSMPIPASPVFSGIYTLKGNGSIGDFPLAPGEQYFLPASLPDISLKNKGETPLSLLRFFGPA